MFLATLSLGLAIQIRGRVTPHLTILLLSAFCIYVYRDMWPFATFSLSPLDAADGWLTWSRIGVLCFAGIILPSITPRVYVPIDPDVGSYVFLIRLSSLDEISSTLMNLSANKRLRHCPFCCSLSWVLLS